MLEKNLSHTTLRAVKILKFAGEKVTVCHTSLRINTKLRIMSKRKEIVDSVKPVTRGDLARCSRKEKIEQHAVVYLLWIKFILYEKNSCGAANFEQRRI